MISERKGENVGSEGIGKGKECEVRENRGEKET